MRFKLMPELVTDTIKTRSILLASKLVVGGEAISTAGKKCLLFSL